MRKAFDQTVRDLKRGVNKNVLKVPSVEQKVLDATSNEPWGPHGSHLADIAHASRNYHEYQMIMAIIWKRINDTGKNWRHVYKALTVLEYMVAHGSERVIDEIREHAYQISTLSDFQYIDSSGRDQGSNVRKKSQSLVVLVNDKERIQEVRQKAAANREKYRNTSMGGMYKPSSYSGVGRYGDKYDDDRYESRYGSREEEQNGYGRERDWGYKDDDKYVKYGESNSREGDRYGRDNEERYGRDGYQDEDSRGRSPSVDEFHRGWRSRSSDRERDRSYEDDGQYSSRGSGGKADDHSQDGSVAGRRLDQKFSEQNLDAPPSYEEALGEARSSAYSERDGETSAASVPKSSSPPPNTNYQETTTSGTPVVPTPSPPAVADRETDALDEFDPRGSFSAAPTSSNGAEMDLLGSLADSFSSNSMAIVNTTNTTTASETDAFTDSGPGNVVPTVSTSSNQPFEDPFGDGPFRAISSADNATPELQNFASTSSFHPSTNHSEPSQLTFQNMETANKFGFGDIDILADILPPSGPSPTGFPAQTVQPESQTIFAAQTGQSSSHMGFQGQIDQPAPMTGFQAQPGQSSPQTSFPIQMGQPSSMTEYTVQAGQPASQSGFPHQSGQPAPQAAFPHQSGQLASLEGFRSQMGTAPQIGFHTQPGPNFNGNFYQQSESTTPGVEPQISTNFIPQSGSQMTPQMQQAGSTPLASTNSLTIVPHPAKDKFETKSTVWADTLNRGLVNLNISGPKTNPLADIGVDFDAINRREKRMEKPSVTPVVSNITMGKAMASGSGIGRAGSGALRGASNPMMGSGMRMGMGMGGGPGAGMGMGMAGGPGVGMGMGMDMGMGMGGGPGAGMGVGRGPGAGMGMVGGPGAGIAMGMGMRGGYGVNQPIGGMGMGMNMGMGQGGVQHPPTRFPPGSAMNGGYNPMMSTGGYGQQPYGGGYQ